MTTEDTFTVTEGNCTTGETIVRNMTPEEISQLLADREAFAISGQNKKRRLKHLLHSRQAQRLNLSLANH